MNPLINLGLLLLSGSLILCHGQEISNETRAFQKLNDHLKEVLSDRVMLDNSFETDQDIETSFKVARKLLGEEEAFEMSRRDTSFVEALQKFLKLSELTEDKLCSDEAEPIIEDVEKAITVEHSYWTTISRIDEIIWCFRDKRADKCY